MEHKTPLGRSTLQVSRIGVGAMTWGDAKGLARLHPAKTAYGGAEGYEEEKRALEASLDAGINLFDTAAMYSGGAAERRLGELARATGCLHCYKVSRRVFLFALRIFQRNLKQALCGWDASRLTCTSTITLIRVSRFPS